MPLTQKESKNYRALLTGKGRRHQRKFLAEGVRLLEEALRFSVSPETLFYAPPVLGDRGRSLVERFRIAGARCEELPARQIDQLSDTKTPQGIIGVFPLPDDNLTQLYSRLRRTILVCDNISDPGNLGTLLRSALAFDFRLVILLGTTAEPFAPKVVRASVGAVFGLPIARADYAELEELVRREHITLLAATSSGDRQLSSLVKKDGDTRYALAVGSEAEGLTGRVLALAAGSVRIDHAANVESLNAAVAGSILMKGIYDLLR